MNTARIKTIAIIVLIGILILMVFKMCNTPVLVDKPPTVIEKTKEKIIVDQKRVKAVTDSMKNIVDFKQGIIISQEEKIILGRQFRDAILDELNKSTSGCKDSVEMKNQIYSLTKKNKMLDSIHNYQIQLNTENLITMNSIITEKDSLYGKLRSSFDTCADNNNQLVLYSNQLEKKLKKSDKRKKVWRTVAVVTSAVVAGVLIKK